MTKLKHWTGQAQKERLPCTRNRYTNPVGGGNGEAAAFRAPVRCRIRSCGQNATVPVAGPVSPEAAPGSSFLGWRRGGGVCLIPAGRRTGSRRRRAWPGTGPAPVRGLNGAVGAAPLPRPTGDDGAPPSMPSPDPEMAPKAGRTKKKRAPKGPLDRMEEILGGRTARICEAECAPPRAVLAQKPSIICSTTSSQTPSSFSTA